MLAAGQTPVPAMSVAAAVIRHGGRVLLTSRPPGKHLAGHWEFPGGKAGPGETMSAALRRELREELGAEIVVLDLLWQTRHRYPSHEVELQFFRCLLRSSPEAMMPREGQQLVWATPAQMKSLPLVPADQPFAVWLTTALGASFPATGAPEPCQNHRF